MPSFARLRCLSTVVAIFVSCLLAGQSFAAKRPDLNSFLDWKVKTVGQLMKQVYIDRVVADRYERHFTMNKHDVLHYIYQLHTMRLREPLKTTVYSVPTDGHIKAHVQSFPKGTKVFADPAGHPILLVKCGNPLVLGPNAVVAESTPSKLRNAQAKGAKPMAFVPIGGEPQSSQDAYSPVMPAKFPDLPAESAPVALVPPNAPIPGAPTIGAPSLVQAPTTTGLGLGSFGSLGTVSGLGSIFVTAPLAYELQRHHHHAPSPVPEPAGWPLMVLVALGGGMILTRRKAM